MLRRFSALWISVLVASVIAALLAAVPVASADEPDPAHSTGNKNTVPVEPGEYDKALVKAADLDKPVELTDRRTAATQQFVNPDGTITERTSVAPIFTKDDDGDYKSIDADLKRVGARLEPKLTSQDVSFSATGTDALSSLKTSAGDVVSLSLLDGPLSAPEVDGGTATYQRSDDETVRVATTSTGIATHVVLDEKPSQAPVYRFKVTAGDLDVALDDGVLTFRDGAKVVAESKPLQMWDNDVDAAGAPEERVAVDSDLVTEQGQTVLELRPSEDWLDDSSREYPVTIDPDISPTSALTVVGDTYVFRGQNANDPRNNEVNLRVGSNDGSRDFRSILYFKYQRLNGLAITDAKLNLWQYSSGSPNCAPKKTNAFVMGGRDVTKATGTTGGVTYPLLEDNARFASSNTTNRGAAGCSPGKSQFDVTNMVSAWAGVQQSGDDGGNDRQAVYLTAGDDFDTDFEKRYCSDNWSTGSNACGDETKIPSLDVTFQPELGTQSWYSTTDHTFNDKSSLSVNNRNGNAVIQNTDASFKGIGTNLTISRAYNSGTNDANTSLGQGWNFGFGPDVWMEKRGTYRFDYHGPTATVLGSFLRKSATPGDTDYRNFRSPIGGVGADLGEDTNGKLTLKFRRQPLRYEFGQKNAAGDAFLSRIFDRSGNEILFSYSGTTTGGRPKLVKITDTAKREYTVTYNGDRITKIAEQAGRTADNVTREWQYSYFMSGAKAGLLQSYTDAESKAWTYDYSEDSRQLISMKGPGGVTDTIFNYWTGAGSTEPNAPKGRLMYVGYRYADGGSGTEKYYKYGWFYEQPVPQKCTEKDDRIKLATAVLDPNAVDSSDLYRTYYCFAPRTNSGLQSSTTVLDPEKNIRSEKYSTDNSPELGASGTGAETASTYSGGGVNDKMGERLEKVTQPKNSATDSDSNRLSSGFQYNGTTQDEPTENSYLPSMARSENNSCSAYDYDSAGRIKTTTTGFQAEANGTCTMPTSTSGTDTDVFERRYESNGNVSETWDANAGSNPTDADKTKYDYWKTSDSSASGYNAGAVGLLKNFRRPGGNCSTTLSERKLCRSYTYDGAGRIKTMTDGRGKVTSYKYDKNDRAVTVAYDGTLTDDCTGLSQSCISYGYDAEGNLTMRSNYGEQATFTYDRLNRRTAQSTPVGGLLGGVDTLSTTYDGASNITSYTDKVAGATDHKVSYTYNKANRLKTVTEDDNASETIDVGTDEDGRTTSLKFPKTSGNGAQVKYDYAKNGRPTELRLENHAGTLKSKIAYGYKDASAPTKDTSQLQKRTVTSSPYAGQNGTVTFGYSKQRLASANDSNGSNYAYTYDKIGNLTKEVAGSSTTYFGYNRAGELCWKGSNNRTASGTPLACDDPSPSGAATYSRDKAGNSEGVSTGNQATPVNERNQVSKIDGADQNYLDQGNDLRRFNGDNRELNSQLGVTAIKNGNAVTYLVRSPDGQLLTSRVAGGKRLNFVSEPSGSVAWLVDSTGEQVGGYKYAPYGKASVYGTDGAANRFRWLGAQQNADTSDRDGHYKFGARYYDLQGHFTQADPLTGGMTDPRTMNTYAYAGGDPINQYDTGGQFLENFFGDSVGTVIGSALGTAVAIGGAAAICAATAAVGCLVGAAFYGAVGGGLGAAVGAEIDGDSKESRPKTFFKGTAYGAISNVATGPIR